MANEQISTADEFLDMISEIGIGHHNSLESQRQRDRALLLEGIRLGLGSDPTLTPEEVLECHPEHLGVEVEHG